MDCYAIHVCATVYYHAQTYYKLHSGLAHAAGDRLLPSGTKKCSTNLLLLVVIIIIIIIIISFMQGIYAYIPETNLSLGNTVF